MFALRTQRSLQWLTLVCLLGCGTELGNDDERSEAKVAQQAAPAPTIARRSLTVPVTVRGSGKASIHAEIFENESVAQGATLLDIHGPAATGRVWDPLTKALYDDPVQGARVRRVITIDMFGHGKSTVPSGLPRGMKFGDLTLDDNVAVIQQVIDSLIAQKLGPQMLVGHSMGSLAITAVQEALLKKGSSMAKLGITNVLLIAPMPSHGRPWELPESVSILEQFVTSDEALGITVTLTPNAWIAASFYDKKAKRVPNTPTPEFAAQAGYVAPEPAATLLQVAEISLPGIAAVNHRPTVRAGAFGPSSGTKIAVVSFSEDLLITPAEVRDFYVHLSGDPKGERYLAVTAPDAVHNITISNPNFVIDAMRSLFK